MLNLDIFNLPKRYTDLEAKLAEARGVGNCQGYITGHNGAESCWALALEHKISILYQDDHTGFEASYWDGVNAGQEQNYLFADYEHEELAVRVAICELTINKLSRA